MYPKNIHLNCIPLERRNHVLLIYLGRKNIKRQLFRKIEVKGHHMIFFKKVKNRQTGVVSRYSFSKCVSFVTVTFKFHLPYINLYSDSKKWRQNDSFVCNTSFLTFCYIQNMGMTFTFQQFKLCHQNLSPRKLYFKIIF